MHISRIDKGLPVTIYTGDDNKELTAKYIDNIDGRSFFIYSQDIYDDPESFADKPVTAIFIIRDVVYKAECRVLGRGAKKSIYDTIILETQTGDFEQSSRRAAVRFDIKTQTKVHEYDESEENSFKGRFICNSVSGDISRDGMRLFTNERLPAQKGDLLTLDFTVIPGSVFSYYSLPAKVMRNHKNMNIFTYPYDYGLRFSFEAVPEQQDRLFNDILKLQFSKSDR